MNQNYEVLEQILRLDIEAGAVSADQRVAQRQLVELAKRMRSSEELLAKTRTELAFSDAEIRRQYKRLDELDEKKAEKQGRLAAAKNDEEHRSVKREVDLIEKDIKETMRKAEDAESRIEQAKSTIVRSENELSQSMAATEDERRKAQEAEERTRGRLDEIQSARTAWLSKLDDILQQRYLRLAKITRNANGPITRVEGTECGNCHISISPQILNLVARGQSVENCPNCHHVLLPQVRAER